MYKVKTPNKYFEGKRAGILFTRGEASFEDESLITTFKELGYEVIEPEMDKPKAKPKAKAKAKDVKGE